MVYSIPFDTTRFVYASINEVYKTLIEAGVLVLIVILVFLQDWRATLVPATTVPVTIIGAFAAMAALGFTVNLSTLFAIVLAIGIVVDDAIVIVEGAARHIEEGLSGHDAAIKAMGELFGPIIGITLVLMSVFIPAAFLPGLTGQMYRQFALVIAATALISAINAATLKPTQCALWLRPAGADREAQLFLPRLQSCLSAGWSSGYVGADRPDDAPQPAHGADRAWRWWASAAGASPACPPRSYRSRTRAMCMIARAAARRRLARAHAARAGARRRKIALDTPGVDQRSLITGISVLDNSATLANARRRICDPQGLGVRGEGEGPGSALDLCHIQTRRWTICRTATGSCSCRRRSRASATAGGFTMKVEMRDGSIDLRKLQSVTEPIVEDGQQPDPGCSAS